SISIAVDGGAFSLLSGVAGVAPACALAGAFAKATANASSGPIIRSIVVLFWFEGGGPVAPPSSRALPDAGPAPHRGEGRSLRGGMRFQQGFAKEDDHFIHRASCGLVGRIYQVDGKHGMRRLSLRLHAGGVGGTVGQLRAGGGR